MKSITVTIVIATIVLGSGYYFYANSAPDTSSDSVVNKNPANKNSTNSTDDSQTTPVENAPRYQEFSPEVLSSTADTKRVLFFYANWCPTCKPVNDNLTENSSQIPANVTVIRVNYNDTDTDQAEKDLAQKYGVTYQHTFVQIDEQGNEVTKWNGGDLEELLNKIR